MPAERQSLSIQQMERTLPYPERMPRKEYDRQLQGLQVELLKMQKWIIEHGERLVLLFEGRDAAGKGGAIRRFTEHLNPRAARVVALAKPNDTERTQWYFQRYITHLPAAGEIVLFDRSWYNRAGVEHVMGFCTAEQYGEFFRQTPDFERSIVQSGIRLFKIWFTVSQDEQRRRFKDRETDPLKQWKLSPMDLEALDRFDAYSRARDVMLTTTDHHDAPWTVVNSNDKRRARLEAIRHVLHHVPYDHKDKKLVHEADPVVVAKASTVINSISDAG
jgi:polyphosphate kinase 2